MKLSDLVATAPSTVKNAGHRRWAGRGALNDRKSGVAKIRQQKVYIYIIFCQLCACFDDMDVAQMIRAGDKQVLVFYEATAIPWKTLSIRLRFVAC